MRSPLDLLVVCKKCGYKETIAYATLKAKKAHNCGQCGQAIDITRNLEAGEAFVKHYGIPIEEEPPDEAAPNS